MVIEPVLLESYIPLPSDILHVSARSISDCPGRALALHPGRLGRALGCNSSTDSDRNRKNLLIVGVMVGVVLCNYVASLGVM